MTILVRRLQANDFASRCLAYKLLLQIELSRQTMFFYMSFEKLSPTILEVLLSSVQATKIVHKQTVNFLSSHRGRTFK